MNIVSYKIMISTGDFVKKLKRLFKLIKFVRGRFPSELPREHDEYESFFNKIFSLYDFDDIPFYRHAISSLILHQGSTTTSMPLYFFAQSIRKSRSNQIAFEIIQKMKEDEKNKDELIE